MEQKVKDIAYVLRKKVKDLSGNEYVLEKIEAMIQERNIIKQYETLLFVIEQIPTLEVVSAKPIEEGIENIQKSISNIDVKLEEMVVFLKSGPKAELVISKGLNIAGSGAQLVATIPLAEMKYPEINIDLEKIKEEGTELSELPKRFFEKIKDYLSKYGNF